MWRTKQALYLTSNRHSRIHPTITREYPTLTCVSFSKDKNTLLLSKHPNPCSQRTKKALYLANIQPLFANILLSLANPSNHHLQTSNPHSQIIGIARRQSIDAPNSEAVCLKMDLLEERKENKIKEDCNTYGVAYVPPSLASSTRQLMVDYIRNEKNRLCGALQEL